MQYGALLFICVADSVDVEHSLKLEPGSTQACVGVNISTEAALTFSVMSNETGGIAIPNPNGTVMGMSDTLLLYMHVHVNLLCMALCTVFGLCR